MEDEWIIEWKEKEVGVAVLKASLRYSCHLKIGNYHTNLKPDVLITRLHAVKSA